MASGEWRVRSGKWQWQLGSHLPWRLICHLSSVICHLSFRRLAFWPLLAILYSPLATPSCTSLFALGEGLAELAQGAMFDLPDAMAGDSQCVGELVVRPALPTGAGVRGRSGVLGFPP